MTNPNDNKRNGKLIPHSSYPLEHSWYVWRKFVEPANKARIAIAAHSYGGELTIGLAKKFSNAFRAQVFAIGLTDSAHSTINHEVEDHLHKVDFADVCMCIAVKYFMIYCRSVETG